MTRFWILGLGLEKQPQPWRRLIVMTFLLMNNSFLKGVLGNLGKPGSVTGSDLSHDMIKHCRQKYNIKYLEFHHLDVTDGEEFGDRHAGQFSLVTSFSCLHWVNDHQAATKLTARVLRKGGKFLHLVSLINLIEE